MGRDARNIMMALEFVFSRTRMVRFGKEQDKICRFIMPLEVSIYEDIDFLCWEWPHMCILTI